MNFIKLPQYYNYLNRRLFSGLAALQIAALLTLVGLQVSDTVLAQEVVSGYQITSPVSGVIKQVYVETGKAVKSGDLLLEYDVTLIASNLQEAEALIKLAKVDLAEAKKERERAEELYDRTVLSDHELQQAKVLYSKASARYASAKNQLIHAQWDKKHSKLYAPFQGRIVKVLSYPGQYVNNEFTAQTLLILEKD